MRSGLLAMALLVWTLAAAPAAAQRFTPGDCGGSRGPVPDPVPDSLLISQADSAALASRENQLWTGRMSGPYPRNVLLVRFDRGTPRAQVQAAVDLVCGEVLKAIAAGVLVRIYTDGSADAFWAAVDALAALPQVRDVGPDVLTFVPWLPFTTFGGGRT